MTASINKLPTKVGVETFAQTISKWQKTEGRHDLPWQNTQDPYCIWLSEIMLQQTQVGTVINYYHRFLARFPTLADLAKASQSDVLAYWAGLGYYARARNLHRCAQTIMAHWGGQFPKTPDEIATLPGIGRSTAAAIAAFSFGTRAPILDGNVKRVFTRFFGVSGYPGTKTVETQLWSIAQSILDCSPNDLDMISYTQGLMDLGATRCTRTQPDCATCPLTHSCYANLHNAQKELPSPRPRQTVPQRACHMMILLHDDKVMLEKRPQNGIWGGLWCLPQFDDFDAFENACMKLRVKPSTTNKMAAIQHTFTHFKLQITPWWLEIDSLALEEPNNPIRWQPLGKLAETGLPAPVQKILQGINQSRCTHRAINESVPADDSD